MERPGHKHKSGKNPYNIDLFISLVGQLVTVEYGEDLICNGILKFVTRYEISIRDEDQENFITIIPKHAVRSICGGG